MNDAARQFALQTLKESGYLRWRPKTSTFEYTGGTGTRVEMPGGTVTYTSKNGDMHREDGPAHIVDGWQYWYRHGQLHRVGGPAVIGPEEQFRAWYVNGYLHRVDGPAVEYPHGDKEWWLHGEQQPGPPPGRGEEILR